MEFQSAKRFHRKGFTGHKVNPPNYRLKLPLFPPDLTNNARMIIRAETRKIYEEKARELKNVPAR